jgi:fused signal recognition particle receptor
MAERSVFRRLFRGSDAPIGEPPTSAPTAVPPSAPPAAETPAPKRASWLQRLKSGLARSSNALSEGIASVLTKRRIDAEALDDFEDLLLKTDLGLEVAAAVTERLRAGRFHADITVGEAKEIVAGEIEKVLAPVAKPLAIDRARKPHVVLVVGVNGTGKTTTIGKLAAKLHADGKTVVLAAGDTFRAAAIDQLKIWGERAGARVVAGSPGADAAGLAFDALKEAKESAADVLLVDTAGRLQNKDELMAELEKIIRVMRKLDPSAPHTVLLTLDATTGQNALNQVDIFGKRAGVTGLVMTKLDGTARGGILVAIAARYRLPVHFIGVGEGIDDLEPFEARDFTRALVGL